MHKSLLALCGLCSMPWHTLQPQTLSKTAGCNPTGCERAESLNLVVSALCSTTQSMACCAGHAVLTLCSAVHAMQFSPMLCGPCCAIQPCAVQFSPALCSSALPCAVQPCPVQFSPALCSSALRCAVQPCPVQFSPALCISPHFMHACHSYRYRVSHASVHSLRSKPHPWDLLPESPVPTGE